MQDGNKIQYRLAGGCNGEKQAYWNAKISGWYSFPDIMSPFLHKEVGGTIDFCFGDVDNLLLIVEIHILPHLP